LDFPFFEAVGNQNYPSDDHGEEGIVRWSGNKIAAGIVSGSVTDDLFDLVKREERLVGAEVVFVPVRRE
jgi:hypothetical protein